MCHSDFLPAICAIYLRIAHANLLILDCNFVENPPGLPNMSDHQRWRAQEKGHWAPLFEHPLAERGFRTHLALQKDRWQKQKSGNEYLWVYLQTGGFRAAHLDSPDTRSLVSKASAQTASKPRKPKKESVAPRKMPEMPNSWRGILSSLEEVNRHTEWSLHFGIPLMGIR